jgi:hypothetical protein
MRRSRAPRSRGRRAHRRAIPRGGSPREWRKRPGAPQRGASLPPADPGFVVRQLTPASSCVSRSRSRSSRGRAPPFEVRARAGGRGRSRPVVHAHGHEDHGRRSVSDVLIATPPCSVACPYTSSCSTGRDRPHPRVTCPYLEPRARTGDASPLREPERDTEINRGVVSARGGATPRLLALLFFLFRLCAARECRTRVSLPAVLSMDAAGPPEARAYRTREPVVVQALRSSGTGRFRRWYTERKGDDRRHSGPVECLRAGLSTMRARGSESCPCTKAARRSEEDAALRLIRQ